MEVCTRCKDWSLPSLELGMSGDVDCATGRAHEFAHLAVKVIVYSALILHARRKDAPQTGSQCQPIRSSSRSLTPCSPNSGNRRSTSSSTI
jgi:hypothetical protein